MLGLSLMLLTLFSWAQLPAFNGIANNSKFICGHTDSKVYCWGDNTYNQAQEIGGFRNIKKVSTAKTYACAQDEIGISCWGEHPTITSQLSQNPNITDFKTLGDSICALISGKIYCEGARVEVNPLNLKVIQTFDMSEEGTCAVQEGRINCWGKGVQEIIKNLPQSLGYVKLLDISGSSACAVDDENQIKCWGGAGAIRGWMPTITEKIVSIHLNGSVVCALLADGQVKCWGSMDYENYISAPHYPGAVSMSFTDGGIPCLLNNLGKITCWGRDSNLLDAPPAVKAPKLMSAGGYGTCFALDRELRCSGTTKITPFVRTGTVTKLSSRYNDVCYVDDGVSVCKSKYGGTSSQIPHYIKPVSQFSIGEHSICVIETVTNNVECWGKSLYPELLEVPSDLGGAKQLVSGLYFNCALKMNGDVSCWGVETTPNLFSGTANIQELIAGDRFVCALLSNDEIKCSKQGPGQLPSILTPPTHLTGIKQIASGSRYACATTETEISCWGENEFGILNPPKPRGKIKKLSLGNGHGCFEDQENIKCWGDNRLGQYQFIQK